MHPASHNWKENRAAGAATVRPQDAWPKAAQTGTLVPGRLVMLCAALIFALSGCQQKNTDSPPAPVQSAAKLTLTSPAFKEGAAIPSANTCDGANASPPLQWSGVPSQAKSLALICEDPDAPGGTFTHWVLYNLPASTTELKEGQATLPEKAAQGKNDFDKAGYGGPCPPAGNPHRYIFHLYALDTPLTLSDSASKQDLQSAILDHILAEGVLMGKYQRQ